MSAYRQNAAPTVDDLVRREAEARAWYRNAIANEREARLKLLDLERRRVTAARRLTELQEELREIGFET